LCGYTIVVYVYDCYPARSEYSYGDHSSQTVSGLSAIGIVFGIVYLISAFFFMKGVLRERKFRSDVEVDMLDYEDEMLGAEGGKEGGREGGRAEMMMMRDDPFSFIPSSDPDAPGNDRLSVFSNDGMFVSIPQTHSHALTRTYTHSLSPHSRSQLQSSQRGGRRICRA